MIVRAPALLLAAAAALAPGSLAAVLLPDCPFAWYIGKSMLGARVVAGDVQAEFAFGAYSIDSPATVWAAAAGLADGVSLTYTIGTGASCNETGTVFDPTNVGAKTPTPNNIASYPAGDLSGKFGPLTAANPSIKFKDNPGLFMRAIQNKPLVVAGADGAVLGCGLIQPPSLATTTIYSKQVGGAVINFAGFADAKAPTWVYGQFLGLDPTLKYDYGIYSNSLSQGYAGAQCTAVGDTVPAGNLSQVFGQITPSAGTDGKKKGSAQVNVQSGDLDMDQVVNRAFAVTVNGAIVACGAIVPGATPLVDTTTDTQNVTAVANTTSSAAPASTGGASTNGTSVGSTKSGAARRSGAFGWGEVALAVAGAAVALGL